MNKISDGHEMHIREVLEILEEDNYIL